MAYSMVRFWSYIFTPLLILALIFAMFVIFTLSSAQTTVGSLIAPALAITSSIAAKAASVASTAASVASTGAANSRSTFSPTPVGTGL